MIRKLKEESVMLKRDHVEYNPESYLNDEEIKELCDTVLNDEGIIIPVSYNKMIKLEINEDDEIDYDNPITLKESVESQATNFIKSVISKLHHLGISPKNVHVLSMDYIDPEIVVADENDTPSAKLTISVDIDDSTDSNIQYMNKLLRTKVLPIGVYRASKINIYYDRYPRSSLRVEYHIIADWDNY